jgi:hypothetical protein
MKTQWFDVDKAGLGRQAEEQGKGRLVGELVQNALDEPGVTQIAVTLSLAGDGLADLNVEDGTDQQKRASCNREHGATSIGRHGV